MHSVLRCKDFKTCKAFLCTKFGLEINVKKVLLWGYFKFAFNHFNAKHSQQSFLIKQSYIKYDTIHIHIHYNLFVMGFCCCCCEIHHGFSCKSTIINSWILVEKNNNCKSLSFGYQATGIPT